MEQRNRYRTGGININMPGSLGDPGKHLKLEYGLSISPKLLKILQQKCEKVYVIELDRSLKIHARRQVLGYRQEVLPLLEYTAHLLQGSLGKIPEETLVQGKRDFRTPVLCAGCHASDILLFT